MHRCGTLQKWKSSSFVRFLIFFIPMVSAVSDGMAITQANPEFPDVVHEQAGQNADTIIFVVSKVSCTNCVEICQGLIFGSRKLSVRS